MSVLNISWNLISNVLVTILGIYYFGEKINDLKLLATKFPKSNYLAASIFETAETYSKDLNDVAPSSY